MAVEGQAVAVVVSEIGDLALGIGVALAVAVAVISPAIELALWVGHFKDAVKQVVIGACEAPQGILGGDDAPQGIGEELALPRQAP